MTTFLLILNKLKLSIYKPENTEQTSIISNFNTLQKLTIDYEIKLPKLLFKAISKNKNLNTLRISNNKLSNLPKEIGLLKNLESFFSSNNKLETELPLEFYELTNLKNIEIQGSNLEVVSEKINNLKKLETLKLYYNKITKTPKELNGLESLKHLKLNNNFLKNFKDILDPINAKLLNDNKGWGSYNFIQKIMVKELEKYNIKGDGLIIH